MDLKNYLKTGKKTHLIFDLDETLAHIILPWDIWEKDIEEKLKKVDLNILRDYKNHKINLSQLENLYVSKHPQTLDLMIKNSKKFESENLQDIRINHELVDFIKTSKNYHIFLWTGQHSNTVKTVLKKLGILEKFEKMATRNNVKLLKPETDGFKLIYDGKTEKSKYLFIGNSWYDRKAANAVGIDFYQEDYFQ